MFVICVIKYAMPAINHHWAWPHRPIRRHFDTESCANWLAPHKPSSREDAHAWLGNVYPGKEMQSRHSFSKQRINFNMSLANAECWNGKQFHSYGVQVWLRTYGVWETDTECELLEHHSMAFKEKESVSSDRWKACLSTTVMPSTICAMLPWL